MNAIDAIDYLESKSSKMLRLRYEELLTMYRPCWIAALAALENLPVEERFSLNAVIAFEAINQSRRKRGLAPFKFR